MIRFPFPALLLVAAAALVAAPAGLAAQCRGAADWSVTAAPEGVVQEVTLDGRTRYQGRVLATGDPVRFELLSGDVLEIRADRITCLRQVSGQHVDGEFWPADPNVTRLFFGPTARALPGGTGYLSVFEVIMPMVAFGVTDRVTVAGGMPLIFGSRGPELFWFAPKVEVVRTDGFSAATGVLAFFGPDMGSVGILYGVGTLGPSSDQAFTFGAGWGYDTDGGIHRAPAFMGGFETRVSRHVKLISENYWLPEERAGLLSIGPRFFGERLSADLGLAFPIARGAGFFTFPLVNFVYNF